MLTPHVRAERELGYLARTMLTSPDAQVRRVRMALCVCTLELRAGNTLGAREAYLHALDLMPEIATRVTRSTHTTLTKENIQ